MPKGKSPHKNRWVEIDKKNFTSLTLCGRHVPEHEALREGSDDVKCNNVLLVQFQDSGSEEKV